MTTSLTTATQLITIIEKGLHFGYGLGTLIR